MTKENRILLQNISDDYNGRSHTLQSNIEFALYVIEKFPYSYFSILRGRKFQKFWNDVLEKTAFLNDVYSEKDITRLYYYINNLKSIIRCSSKNCDKVYNKKIIPRISAVHKFHCCNRCAQNDIDIQKKIHSTKAQNHTTTKDLIDKRKKSNLKKYNCEWYFQTDEFKNKAASTWKNNGYEHPMKDDAIRHQMKERYFNKYGVDCPFKNPEIQKLMKKKYRYDNLMFDFKPEIAYYIWLKDNNINFTYQPNSIIEYEYDGKVHFYMPDFIVDGEFVEIKGVQFFKEDGTMQNPFDHTLDGLYEAKHRCMIENNVKIMLADEYSKYVEYVDAKYGKNHLDYMKVQH